ncbi:hypothetical protein SFUMM280S_09021 [Streptomyces fumanus]
MQLLVRHIYDKSATSAHVRYALTEIEDECGTRECSPG